MAEKKKTVGTSSAKAGTKGSKAKKTARGTKTGTAKKSASDKKTTTKRETTKRTVPKRADRNKKAEPAKPAGPRMSSAGAASHESMKNEIIAILVIVASAVVFISILTERMGYFGIALHDFFLGILGLGGLLLPVVSILYCIWFLRNRDPSHPMIRLAGCALLILTIASASHIFSPVQPGRGMGFFKHCAALYTYGSLANGGLIGGLIGGALVKALDVLGSVIVLLAVFVISMVMATGKSVVHAAEDLADHHRTKKYMKNERIKHRAEIIREEERLAEQERLRRKERRTGRPAAAEEYNFEIESYREAEEKPAVKETVFRKRDIPLSAGGKAPIYDFAKDTTWKFEEKERNKNYRDPFAEEAEEEVLPAEPVKEEDPELPEFMKKYEHFERKAVDPFAERESDFEIEEEQKAKPEAAPAEQTEEAEKEEVPAEETAPEGEEQTPAQAAEPKKTEPETAPVQQAEKKEPAPKPYRFPPISLLGKDPKRSASGGRNEIVATAKKLELTLKSFGVDAKVVQVSKGPAVTRYELSPSQGVKVSKIVNLSDDIALNLAASGIRIEAPIPGKSAVGIEVPNKEKQPVYLRTVLESEAFKEHPSKLAFALGQDIAGKPVVTDIAKMPHLLIAGATGSGKSVCINTLITSILYKADPKEVKLLLVDPKVVELSVYNGIPHLLIPVVTDPKKASAALNWAAREMMNRYKDFAAAGVRDIEGFNAYKENKGEPEAKMPHIVIIIDELSDLMMVASGEVEDAVCRLAQMARAAGMHLIIATQRPSVDVITGVIKANIPSRLAFAVSSGIDSRTILDMVGAEKLLGKGDMLFYPAGQSKPSRLQGAFVTDKEVEEIVSFLKENGRPDYRQETMDEIAASVKIGLNGEELDEFFEQAVELVIEKEKASVSMLQRQFRIGYNRAARLMDEMEKRKLVGPEEGSKPRKVLVTKTEWEEMNAPKEKSTEEA